MCSIQDRELGEGRIYRRLTEVLLPNVRIVPSVAAGEGEGFERARHIGWVLPIDDTHTRMYSLLRVPLRDGQPVLPPRARHRGKLWAELTRRSISGCRVMWRRWVSQRPIALHGLEHLARSDQGVIRLRRMLRRAIDAVRRGEDPSGILRDPTRDLVTTKAGNPVVVAGDRT
jgi:hypothetical protein